MINIYFSPSKSAFYREDYKELHEMSGSWPADLIPVSTETYLEFTGDNPAGKIMQYLDGEFSWVNDKSSVDTALMIKSNKTSAAIRTISIWQTKLSLGRISDDEKVKLNAWLDYIEELEAIDPNSVEDSSTIQWPTAPEA